MSDLVRAHPSDLERPAPRPVVRLVEQPAVSRYATWPIWTCVAVQAAAVAVAVAAR